ncbi:MAG: alpha/beta hydrolase family protein, partial [Acidobacteriota bacterium]
MGLTPFMFSWFFHSWERHLASVSKDRVIRPFEWGLDWLDSAGVSADTPPAEAVNAWAAGVMQDSDAFYYVAPTRDYHLDGDHLTFPSALTTPHPENNTVHSLYVRAADGNRRRAVVVMPQWNADANGHVALCRLMARFGISSLRLSLPYHDARMPPELTRADYIVSSNIGRTAQVCRQAVLDARRAVAWLAREGYERIGIIGTSLGSCLAMLTTAHEPLIRAAALNHISPFFADVVWEGLSTSHVRQGLDGNIDLDRLRRMWLPISPFPFLDRVKGRKILLVYAKYDLTFPVRLSRRLVEEFRARDVAHELAVLPCGHYSTGVAPFSWMDAYVLIR